MGPYRLLDPAEGAPVAVLNEAGRSDVVLVCEHASRTVPRRLAGLGLDPAVLDTHVAWDPGALVLAEALSETLDAVLLHQRFSRLVYDCNRPPHAASAIPCRSEVYDIAGNAAIGAEERQARVAEIYAPFRDGLASLLAARAAAARRSALVTVHSFTPVYFGARREVEIGILNDSDARLADAMLAAAAGRQTPFVVRRNEPYGPADGVTHTLVEHGVANGIANVMIEVRNDLLRTPADVLTMRDYLAGLLAAGLDRI